MEKDRFNNKEYLKRKSILSQCKLIVKNNILTIENHEKDFDKAIYAFKKELQWRVRKFMHFNDSIFENYDHRVFFDDLFISYAVYCFKYKWEYCCLSSETTEFNINSVFTYMRLFANNAKVLEKRLKDDKIYINSTDLPNFRAWSERVKNEGNYIFEIERLSKYVSFVLDMSYADLKMIKNYWYDTFDNNGLLFKINSIIDNYQCALNDCFNDDYYLNNKNVTNENSNEKKLCEEFLKKHTIIDIYDKLDSSVHKQERAKKKVSVIVNHHIKRIARPEMQLRKKNMLIFGPSGSGKTQLMETIKELVPVQVFNIDMSAITPEGWSGTNLSNCFAGIKKTLKEGQTIDNSIVFLDEFDKIFGKSDYVRDEDYRKDMQSNLLRLLENGDVINSNGELICNCANCTFIMAGAFPDLLKDDDIVMSSITDNKKINTANRAEINDRLLKFGMMRELLGRIGDVEQLYELTTSDFKYIIKTMDNSVVNSVIQEMDALGIRLYIDDEALDSVAKYAKESGLGVRGANTIIQEVVDEMKFDLTKNNKKSGRLTKNRIEKYLK